MMLDEEKFHDKTTFHLLNSNGDTNNKIEKDETKKGEHLLYGVNDTPSWPTTLLFGFQQIIVCASGIIATPLIVADMMCGEYNPLARVKMVGTVMVICGIGTFLQSTFGLRLPLLQGPSFAFIPPIMAMMAIPEYMCPPINEILSNNSNISLDDLFDSRMQVVQGALLAAAAFEMILGLTGLIGLITKFVGPLTIAPLMLCLEISAAKFCLEYTSKHWVSIVVIGLLLLTALYLHTISVPIPACNKKDRCHVKKFPIFSVFPYLIAISIAWIMCIIFTTTDVFSKENHGAARTDLRSFVISDAPWFRVPYPGQWGPIGFNFGVFLGFAAATLASVTESVGDYYACARACHQPQPPSHAVNRGIMMEGLACFVGALVGSGVGVTTYSENIGVIGITKVASRRTMQIAAIIFIIFGMFTKFGAVLATIPDPIVGGILVVSCAMVGGVGMASLQTVDMKLSRNLAILGCAIFMGILIPSVVTQNPFNTGHELVDQLLNILCSIQMFIAGVTGFILDNTVSGATREQRGFSKQLIDNEWANEKVDTYDVYGFGGKLTSFLQKIPFSSRVPFLSLSKSTTTTGLNLI